MTWRQGLADWLPPRVLDQYRRWRKLDLRFVDHHGDWASATARCAGYGAANILDRVAAGTRDVEAGRAASERDGFLFDEITYPFPILTALLRAAALGDGMLDVVDFGGSLGSTYRDCRPLLSGLKSVRWQVLEQPAFVELGQREFERDDLRFFGAIEDLPSPSPHRVLLLSSVLQYLEAPDHWLREFALTGARHLVIDRTPMSRRPAHELCIQQVPRFIYEASYPCWILSREALLATLADRWSLVAEHVSTEGLRHTVEGRPFEFKGLLLDRVA